MLITTGYHPRRAIRLRRVVLRAAGDVTKRASVPSGVNRALHSGRLPVKLFTISVIVSKSYRASINKMASCLYYSK